VTVVVVATAGAVIATATVPLEVEKPVAPA